MSKPTLIASPTTRRLLNTMAHGRPRVDDPGLDFALWWIKRVQGAVTFADGSVLRWDQC